MSKRLEDLDPYVKHLAERFIEECRKNNINVLIYETLRTKEEQNALYEKGRSKPGQKVTNAKGGYSFHNYGLAFDCVPTINGNSAWNRADLYERMGIIGKSIGLEWGGDFKSIKDRPHFQATGGLSIKELLGGRRPVFPNIQEKREDKELINALNKLVEKGVVNSPDYWINNAVAGKQVNGEYVEILIKRVSKLLG